MDGIKEASHFLNNYYTSTDKFMAHFRDRHSQLAYHTVLCFEFGDILKESDVDEVSELLDSYGYKVKTAICRWKDVAKYPTGNPLPAIYVLPNYQPIKALYVTYDESFLNEVVDASRPNYN